MDQTKRNPRKILCVHQSCDLYGSDRMFIQSIQLLRQSYPNDAITVHLPYNGPLASYISDYADHIIIGDMFVLWRRNFNWKKLTDLPRTIIRNYRRAKRHDIIYLNTITLLSYMIAMPFIRRKGIVHIHEIVTGSFERIIFNFLLWWSRCTLLCNSHATKKSLSITRRKGYVILNGIPIIRNKDTRVLIPDRPLHLLLIGRINAWKGHFIALQAIKLLKEESIACPILRIVGDVFDNRLEHLDALHHFIREHDLHEHISIHSFSDDPTEYYQWSDIVLVPSIKPEPFGLVALEAMHHTRAVIASDHGGLQEVVSDSITGKRVKPHDPYALKEVIKDYIDDHNMIVNHGFHGYDRLKELFSIQSYHTAFISFFV